MKNDSIKKRRLTKTEGMIYDELSPKSQRAFLKLTRYKRKRLVDRVIRNMERRHYDVSELKDGSNNNYRQQDLKKRLTARKMKQAAMVPVTVPLKAGITVKKAKDRYKQKEAVLDKTGKITHQKIKKTQNISKEDRELLKEKQSKNDIRKRQGKDVRKSVGKQVDKALAALSSKDMTKNKTFEDRRREMAEKMQKSTMKHEAKAAAKIGKTVVKYTAKLMMKLGSYIAGLISAAFPGLLTICAAALIIGIVLSFTVIEREKNESYNGIYMISDEVEAYREDVLKELNKYEKEEYIELSLAVMMQESGGRGEDVFRCAESLGKQPGDLKTEESIKQGVKYLSGMMDAAGVKNPDDLDGIKLALHGYNFGGGYITYALSSDGKWTKDNVYSYAKLKSNGVKRTGTRAEIMGVWNYGDQNYAEHVLRYYGASGSISAESVENVKGMEVSKRMEWLFPSGIPQTEAEMRKYLKTIKVKIHTDTGETKEIPITCHAKLAEAYKKAFEGMYELGFKIKYAGCYCWRNMASNSSQRSYHSYGTCIDINPDSNPATYTGGYYKPGEDVYSLTPEVISVWKNAGFYWGGDWEGYYRDYMHFTYTDN